MIGGVAGGYLGGLFDPSDLEQALHNFRTRLRDQTSVAFGEGIKEATRTGDVDAAFEHVAGNLTEIIQGAVITAFVETAVIKGAMGPLTDAISDAMEQGLGPTAFMRHIMPGLEQFRGRLDLLRPLFGEMVGVFGDIGQILRGNATTTDQWRTSLGGAADVAAEIRGEIEAIPTDITVTVHGDFGESSFQHGGFVEAGGIVHAGEYVVNAAATRQNRGLLEAINAGGGRTTWSGPSPMDDGMTEERRRDAGDRALMLEQNALLREQNALLRRIERKPGGGLPAGAASI